MKRPVFIVGCPRSGTTLLYSMLVAAGGFAVYRKETYFFDLVHRFPDLTDSAAQEEFSRRFLAGYLGRVPGLDVVPLVQDALRRCRTATDFLPRLMDLITAAQGMDRWLEATPAHVLYMDRIRRTVPDALFIHVIRDGRDCAISNVSQGWVPALPWDGHHRIGVAALLWEWMVRKGRAFACAHPDVCFDVRFEDLLGDPAATLDRLGRFIDHDLDYGRIRDNPVHALKRPNTSFREEARCPDFNPLGRWKEKIQADDLRLCETLVGDYLEQLGYELSEASAGNACDRLRTLRMRGCYLTYFEGKHRLKSGTPLGRFLTSTTIWSEQPKAGEDPVRPVPALGG